MHWQLELNKFESNSEGPVRLFIIYPKLPKAWDSGIMPDSEMDKIKAASIVPTTVFLV